MRTKTSRLLLMSVAYFLMIFAFAQLAEGHSCGCGYWNGSSCTCSGDCPACEDCKSSGESCSCQPNCGTNEHCCTDAGEYCCPDGKECCEGDCCGSDQHCCTDATDGYCCDDGKYCWYGFCVECRDLLDCELCEECIGYNCVHPCDECYYPMYCAYACACVECYPGEEDTTTCSSANSTTECDCSMNLLNPCSSAAESVVYSGASLTSCTGPDCSSKDVLCYTTYDECKVSGSYQALKWCSGNDVGPPTCQIILDLPPGPGCWTCVNAFESGDPTHEPQGECPTEAWPEE